MKPASKRCFLCQCVFLAEWARDAAVPLWHASEICAACEAKLRERAA